MKRILAGLAVIAIAAGGAFLISLTSVPAVSLKTDTPETGAVFVVKKRFPDFWNLHAVPYPDPIQVLNYVGDTSTITFYYKHKSTHIVFKDKLFDGHQPDCESADNLRKKICTLVLPKGLLPKTPYKYTITGKNDDDNALKPNDPDIEVFP